MTKHLIARLIKTFMIIVPTLCLVTMLLALWGIGGKIIYPDLNLTQQAAQTKINTTKSYMANDSKNSGLCNNGINAPEITVDKKGHQTWQGQPPERIKWELVV